jgi:peptidoglycan-associated lipoprotein
MWMPAYAKLIAMAKPIAFTACLLFAAGCAENKPPAPEAQATGGVEPGSPQDFLLNVGDRVFFNENSADLSPTAISALDKQAVWLVRFPTYTVNVEGHSDEKGDKKKNAQLSAKRAQVVEKYLVSKGVNPSSIRISSFGKDRRVANCNDVSCWSQNRRVVTVLQTSVNSMPMRQQPEAQRLPTYGAAPRG